MKIVAAKRIFPASIFSAHLASTLAPDAGILTRLF